MTKTITKTPPSLVGFEFPDLSHYEPQIDFHAMKSGGIPLFITKATQGDWFTDNTFIDFYKRGKSVGLTVGAYVYLENGLIAPQVNRFVTVANLKPGDLQPVIDMEAPGLTKRDCLEAIDVFRSHGFKPIAYCNLSFWRDVMGSHIDAPLWLAAYRSNRPVTPAAQELFAWQFTDQGLCYGVAKPCDMSRFYGTLDDLKRYTVEDKS